MGLVLGPFETFSGHIGSLLDCFNEVLGGQCYFGHQNHRFGAFLESKTKDNFLYGTVEN